MTKPIYPHELRSFAGMDELVELALDLRWSWDHGADNIWRPLAPELWDLTRNPWIILQTVGPDKLKELADNQEFCQSRKKTQPKEPHPSQRGYLVSKGIRSRRADPGGLLQHGVHVRRGPAHLLGRLGQRRR